MRWIVRITKTATDEIEHEIDCSSESSADRVERGVHININHDDYHTDVVEVEDDHVTKKS